MGQFDLLACWSCRRQWWQCRERILCHLDMWFRGWTRVQCTYHEDIETHRRKTEARRMLEWVTKEKARLERILNEEG